MRRTRIRPIGAATAAFAMLLAACVQPTNAEQPEPQLRIFAVAVPTPDTPPPDLLSPASTLLVVQDDAPDRVVLSFCDNAPSDLLAGTKWSVAYTMHVANGGVQTYPTFWLGGRPPNGARAWTGSEGDVEILAGPFYVRPATGSGGECSTTQWWVDDRAEASFFTWYVGIGLFSK